MNKLENILDESLLHSASGDRKALRLLLKKVIPDRFHYYHESRDITRQEEYADLLYKILLLELDEEEEESIELAELAYLGISECISSAPVHIYECLKKRIILMHYFADYFTDSLIEVFLKKYRENNLLEARNLALESIERMQLFDIFLIEQNFDDRIDRDEQLTDVCNGIELAPNLTDEELMKAKYRKWYKKTESFFKLSVFSFLTIRIKSSFSWESLTSVVATFFSGSSLFHNDFSSLEFSFV